MIEVGAAAAAAAGRQENLREPFVVVFL